jgi:hypothetical protein
MAKKIAEECYATYLRKGVRGLFRIASLLFFFDNEVLSRIEDIETRYKNFFSQRTSAPRNESPGAWQLKDIKAMTIAEWKKEWYDVQPDRLLRSTKLNDDDFMVRIVGEKGTDQYGISLYTRSVEGQLKLAGFWV